MFNLIKPELNNETLHVNEIEIVLVRSTRRKTLAIEINQHGVKVRAPQRMSERIILKFIRSKENWIKKHLSNRSPILKPIVLQAGCELMLLGEPHILHITDGRGEIRIDEYKNIIVPITKSHLPLSVSLKNKLVKWYKQTAIEYLEPHAIAQANTITTQGTTPKIKVRDYRRRWGSCDHRGDLSFNWRIIMAPTAVINYVVIHELSHLIEFNHSKKFWNIVEQQMPDWRKQQQWLRQNGSDLYRF